MWSGRIAPAPGAVPAASSLPLRVVASPTAARSPPPRRPPLPARRHPSAHHDARPSPSSRLIGRPHVILVFVAVS